jgi:filamentous hemagglutinin family protein
MKLRRLVALTLALSQGLGIGTMAWANPVDPTVVQGGATFNNNGNVLTITNRPGTIINWGGFSIAPNEITRFVQDNGASAVLNRITGQDPSVILGALQSNGHVFLVNPNGIVFGAGARVDVNGLVASSLDISNDDFRAGRLKFDAGVANPGAVRNDGAITTPSGGRVYLIAPSVENSGLINSPQGDVVLAAGRQVQLVDSRNPDLHVVASAPTDRAMNLGKIISEGGSIGIYGALINQRGVVDADSATVGDNGRIVFKASDTTLLEAGSTTTARGAGAGGSVHVLGEHVGVTDNASIDASGRTGGGTVLVGGDYRGENPAIVNASATYVGAGTSIRADATDSGDGGRVIVWAHDVTRAYGQISARGGQASGNGGFAEVSGHAYLDYRGRTDLRATNGAAGTLLLDPNDITIQANGTTDVGSTTSGPVTFSGGTGSSALTTTDLANQLALGNVTVTTSGGTGGPQGGHITVADGFGWSNGNALTLDADNGISINGAITGNSDGRLVLVNRGGSITQGAAGGINTTYLVVNSVGDVDLTGATNLVNVLAAQVGSGHNFSFLNGMTFLVSSLNGVTGISAPGGNVSLRTTSGDIRQAQGAIISANAASFVADNVILEELNNVNTISGSSTGALTTAASPMDGRTQSYQQGINSFSFTNQGNLTIGGSGITAATGDVTLSSNAGSLALNSPVTATNGGVYLNAYQGAITGAANGLAVAAYAGGAISLTTQTPEISAGTSGATSDITINNTGALTVDAITNAGSGAISVSTSGPLNVSGITSGGNGAVTLSAGPTGSTTDNLTVNGNITTQVDSGGAIETGGPVLLRAGNTITITGTVTGSVTQQANLNTPVVTLPTIDQCIANPALAGCDQVLPTLNQCVASPSTLGCSVVLPSLATCTASPTTAGCSAVLPSLATCTAAPTTAGCSAVLPSLATCTASPTTAGCSAVLPSLATCTASPTTAGCSAVLPSLATCTASPTTAGCSAVLPSLATCLVNPATAGCSAVLPSMATCTASPTTTGCTLVLPTFDQCMASPSTPGCSVVLPSITQCVASPTTAGCAAVLPTLEQCAQSQIVGCSVVLPTLAQCTANPSLTGCSMVLPSLNACIANPSATGCSAVLPSTAQCAANPALPGCSAVIPTLDQCIANPSAPGCSGVLPSFSTCVATPTLPGCSTVLAPLTACIANPAAPGCSSVLPPLATCLVNPAQLGCSAVISQTFNFCLANPHDASCVGVLPTISQCVVNRSTPGCQAVLPTLQQCIGSPTLQGCSVVLPRLEQCAANPALAGCEAVLPKPDFCSAHPTDPTCAVFNPGGGTGQGDGNGPVSQTVQTTVTLINSTTGSVNGTGSSSSTTSSSGSTSTPDKGSDGKQSGPAASENSGAKNEKPATKTYCN